MTKAIGNVAVSQYRHLFKSAHTVFTSLTPEEYKEHKRLSDETNKMIDEINWQGKCLAESEAIVRNRYPEKFILIDKVSKKIKQEAIIIDENSN